MTGVTVKSRASQVIKIERRYLQFTKLNLKYKKGEILMAELKMAETTVPWYKRISP